MGGTKALVRVGLEVLGDPRGVSDSCHCNPSSRHTGGHEAFDDCEPAQTTSAQRHVLEVLKRSDVFEVCAVCPMKLGFEHRRRGRSRWEYRFRRADRHEKQESGKWQMTAWTVG